jgi:phosphodiesterase/alkaline phosphatase D-like protein
LFATRRWCPLAALAVLWALLPGAAPAAEQSVTFAWSGALTSTSIRITAQVDRDAQVRVALSRTADLAAPTYSEVRMAASSSNRIVSWARHGLSPDTRYHYALEVDGVLDRTVVGRFRTAPEGAASFTVGVGACASTGSDHPVFDTIRAHDPLFFLHTGDMFYENIQVNDRDLFRQAYNAVLTAPRQARLHRSTSTVYMWDDHDYGPNDSDATAPGREASRRTYQEYVPHHPLVAGAGDVPIHQAFTVGRVRFIVTDLRSERTPNHAADDAEKSMMGAAQKAWFKDELLRAADEAAGIVWVSTVPWIAAPHDGADHWGGFSTERREIAEFIAEHRIDRKLVMVAGDAHMVAVDDGSNSGFASDGGGGFPVFHAAALDRVGTVKGGPYSNGAYPGGGQFGLLSVTDDGGDVQVSFSGRRADDSELVRYTHTIRQPRPGTGRVPRCGAVRALPSRQHACRRLLQAQRS